MSESPIVPEAILAGWKRDWARSGRARIAALIHSNDYPSFAELQQPHGRHKLVEARKWIDEVDLAEQRRQRWNAVCAWSAVGIGLVTLFVTMHH